MIDPLKFESIGSASESFTNAQYWLLFAVMVANKSADQTRDKLLKLLTLPILPDRTPFEKLDSLYRMCKLLWALQQVRSGQYTRICRAFQDIRDKSISTATSADPRLWSLEELEGIRGIGPKTARWFYLLVHPTAKVAALDTHVLKFLRDQGESNVPKSTPPKGNVYKSLEARFLAWADKLGLPPRDMDFMVWTIYRNKGKITF